MVTHLLNARLRVVNDVPLASIPPSVKVSVCAPALRGNRPCGRE